MDLIRIIELLLTSFTSIFVALVGAGFFKKITQRREKLKSKDLLMEQIKKDEIIHLSLRQIRRDFNVDRIYIWQFHNGGYFYSQTPMQKISITYERCSEGLERNAEKNQNVLMANFNDYVKDVINGEMFFIDINDIQDLGIRSLNASNGTQSHCAVPIYDNDKQLIAILSMDWVFSEIPKEIIEDSDFKQDFKDELLRESNTLYKYL
jgi:hypothetical protein